MAVGLGGAGHEAGFRMQGSQAVADILAKVLEGASLKSLCHANRKAYAIVSHVLKRLPLLKRALTACQWEHKCVGIEFAEALLLVHELLYGVGVRKSTSEKESVRKLRILLMHWQASLLKSSKSRTKSSAASKGAQLCGTSSTEPPRLPRYARVNTLVARVEDVIDSLRLEGFCVLRSEACGVDGPPAAGFWRDSHVQPLLVLPAGCELHGHAMVASGAIILQDKASCFPPAALNPATRSSCVDCCAAPGNKTTQLASLVGASGNVLAVERDAQRAQTLGRRLKLAMAQRIVTVLEGDFLSVDPAASPQCDAEYLLLDPSCSGSGIVERSALGGEFGEASDVRPEEAEEERVRALAAMQLRLILHAFSFSSARRISYSTCSVHAMENEVVALAAARHPLAQRLGWKLAPALPGWACRGLPLTPECQLLMRAGPEWGTNGFFVACFERQMGGISLS